VSLELHPPLGASWLWPKFFLDFSNFAIDRLAHALLYFKFKNIIMNIFE